MTETTPPGETKARRPGALKKALLAAGMAIAAGGTLSGAADTAQAEPGAVHRFAFQSIDGGPLPLKRFAGKAVLVVNTASRCGFTHQYEGLQRIWTRYRDRGLVVLGVPSNDFGRQELASEAAIKQFCEVNFNVDFPLTERTQVKGDGAHPFYRYAREALGAKAAPKWNFHKYLVTPDGRLAAWFSTATGPDAKPLIAAIEAHLPE